MAMDLCRVNIASLISIQAHLPVYLIHNRGIMREFPQIKTQRLILRELSLGDCYDIFEIFASEAVTRYYDLATFSELNEAASWIELMRKRYSDENGIRWAITLGENEKVMGTCGFTWRPQNFSAVLGYELAPEIWGNGYITEAVTAIVAIAFNEVAPFKLNRIEAFTYPQNTASMSVLQKLNFEKEGLLRQWGYWKNSFHDLVCFSMLRQNWSKPT